MKKLNKIRNLKILFVLSFAITTFSCSGSDDEEEIELPIESTTRIIEFSGYEWVVRTSDENQVGPGPNLFSDSEQNVWVDQQGRLHLKIVQKAGKWYCSGITLREDFGHNKYIFYVSSRVD